MRKLLQLLRDDAAIVRNSFPLFVGFVYYAAPLLDPSRGWEPWPDLLYQSMTLYLVIQTAVRVRKAWREQVEFAGSSAASAEIVS